MCENRKHHGISAKLEKTMKSLRRTRSRPGIEHRFLYGQKVSPSKSKPTSMKSVSLFFREQQLHLQGALTSYHRGREGWRGRRQRRQPVFFTNNDKVPPRPVEWHLLLKKLTIGAIWCELLHSAPCVVWLNPYFWFIIWQCMPLDVHLLFTI